MNSDYQSAASASEWNAAHYRLDDYLRAHGFTDRVFQTRVLIRILDRAKRRHQDNPCKTPICCAIEEADELMQLWFASVLTLEAGSAERALSLGRLHLHLSDAMSKWPTAFLSEEGIPMEFRKGLESVRFVPNPELRVSPMVPRELDGETESMPINENRLFRWVWAALIVCAAMLGIWVVLGK